MADDTKWTRETLFQLMESHRLRPDPTLVKIIHSKEDSLKLLFPPTKDPP